MRRIAFKLDLDVLELSNVPMFDDTQCYMVCTISNDKIKNNYKKIHISSFTSPSVGVKNHRVKFGVNGKHKADFKLQAQTNSMGDVISDKWLCISFLLKYENTQELLGVLNINLADYVNETKRKDLRFLLERSKTNTIVKLNILIDHMDHDEGITYQTSSNRTTSSEIPSLSSEKCALQASGFLSISKSNKNMNDLSINNIDDQLSLSRTRTPISNNSGRSGSSFIPSPKAVNINKNTGNGRILDNILSKNERINRLNSTSPKSSVINNQSLAMSNLSGRNGSVKKVDTQNMMNKACESALSDNSMLDELISKTFRFMWQLKSVRYEEFTPAECVKDIVEHNGNGWRKNDEGFDMVDVIENEFREAEAIKNSNNWFALHANNQQNDQYNSSKGKNIFANFENFENFDGEYNNLDDDTDEESGDDDVFRSYYKGTRAKSTRTKRFKPLTESEVRDDLRSWHISVKE